MSANKNCETFVNDTRRQRKAVYEKSCIRYNRAMSKETENKLEQLRRKRQNRKGIVRLLAAIILLAFTVGLWYLFKKHPGQYFPGYRKASKKIMDILSCAFSFVPFTVWDIGLVLLILLFVITLIVMIVKRKSFLKWFGSVLLICSFLLSIAVDAWMLNHYAPPLAEEIGLPIREYTEDELADAFLYYYSQAAACADLIERDADGVPVKKDFNVLAEKAGSSYAHLSETYEIFEGSTQPVKKIWLFGKLLMYSGITGEFMPITGESGVPAEEVAVNMPFTMCHEAAHRLGIASEEEANFAAYLACEDSEDPDFRYSGYYSAFIYTYNALAKKNVKRLKKLIETHRDDGYALVLADSDHASEYYKQYESPLEEVETKVNDTYLKTFDEESGVQSYGEVADELIAWRIAGNGWETEADTEAEP